MLNPDGAERYARRNAQAIDINRDALHLATPEGRVLKGVRDRFQPELGFNLHDQNRRTTVGDTGVLATISLLAVSGDPEGTVTPGRARAKRVCSAIARALEPFVPGGIGRYDEDWNPRAFGDNVTAWGTPVVLIESGGVMPGRPLSDLTRLNYVALLTALHGLVRDDLAGETPDLYEGLKRNDDGYWTDVLARRRPRLAAGRGRAVPRRRGLRRARRRPARRVLRRARLAGPSRIREVGDGAAARGGAAGGRGGPPARPRLRRLRARARRALVADRGGARRRGPARRGAAALARGPGRAARGARPRGRGSRRPAGRRSRSWTRARRPTCWRSPRPPGPPSSPALESALDALTRRRRGASAPRGRPLGELSGELAGDEPGRRLRSWPWTPRASLVVLRPREEGALDAARLDLEAVFVDGREPGGRR